MTLRAGDWVEVRSKEEILATLDKNGRLQELPFMPQMFEYCGKRFRVFKRAHKTCDTVNPVAGRRVPGGIHLDLRCDGKAYGGCQASCLIFWKEAWLRPLDERASSDESRRHIEVLLNGGCAEQDVLKATSVGGPGSGEETRYTCQATQLPYYTTPLAWYDIGQYVDDYRSGNVSLGRMFIGFVYVSYYYASLAFRGRLGRPARWLYDRFQSVWGGVPFPRKVGTVPVGQTTPTATLNLQPGERVRVKSYDEILATLDGSNNNRGLSFDAELVPFCGRVYRVKSRITKFINEKTGTMSTMKTPAIILEGVWCQARYSECRMFCPRSIYSWWREIWLERIPEN
jgi:hypothetical protein